MQNGFLNCKWIKDNKVVKTEEETSGTKADFIFNISMQVKLVMKMSY